MCTVFILLQYFWRMHYALVYMIFENRLIMLVYNAQYFANQLCQYNWHKLTGGLVIIH